MRGLAESILAKGDGQMKILLVALADSIHTARWVSQITDRGWDVRLFPSLDPGVVHPALSCIPVYHTLWGKSGSLARKQRWPRLAKDARAFLGMRLLPILWPQRRVQQLCRVIDDFQPDIVHALEFQAAGYLTVKVIKTMGKAFPWIASIWGSDIYWFRQFPEHERKIREVLQHCDYFACECQRDVCLARGLGFKGILLPLLPAGGGFDLQSLDELRRLGPVSSRRSVVLKGYHHWVGRAVVGLAALEECTDLLRDYEVVIHSPSSKTRTAALAFAKRTGVKVTMLPPGTQHREILTKYGQARVSLGISLSDGLPASLLEALVMGAFPIQSWTACADEWIEDGKSGLLVPPEDVASVAVALRRALTDDDLVNSAAIINWRTAKERLDHHLLKQKAVDLYAKVSRDSRRDNAQQNTGAGVDLL